MSGKHTLTSSLPICIPLFSFSLNAGAQTSSAVLSRYGEHGHSGRVLNFNGVALNFSTSKLILTVGLPLSIMLRCFPLYSILCRIFVKKGCWIFKRPFLHVMR